MSSLSVIIPTRNRARRLAACLESLCAQTLSMHEFEVIVVDNGSTDATAEEAARYASRLRLTYRQRPEPGLHVGRHEGMRVARSDLLVFCDDDIEAVPTWLAALRAAFADPRVAMAGGNIYPAFEADPPAWLSILWARLEGGARRLGTLSLIGLGEGQFGVDPGDIWGCNFSVRRRVLVEAGGFHPDALPSELMLYRGDGETHVSNHVRAAGLLAWFDSRASVTHFVPASRMSPDYFARRYFAQGISDSYAAIRSRGRAPGLRECLHAFWRRAGARLRWRDVLRGFRDGETERQLRRVLRDAEAAYTDGYWRHTRAALADRGLLDWILRKDYFDAVVPGRAAAPEARRRGTH